jgi:hypothetical protein
MLIVGYAQHPFTSLLFLPEAAGFADECLSHLQFRDGPSGVAYLKALALQNGFRLSARDSDKGDRIRLYCHRASRGEGHRRTTKTACPMKIQLLRQDGLYHVSGKRQLEHNHDMLTSLQADIPEDIQATVADLLKVGVEKTRILDYVYLRTGRLLSSFQLAAIDSKDLQIALDTDTNSLLEYMQDKGECRLFELLMDEEQKRAAILTITNEERQNLERFGDVVFLDGTVVRNPLGWNTYPIILVDDEKGLISGGLLFTAYEREQMFEWLLQSLHEILGATLRTIFTDEDSAIVPAMENLRSGLGHDVAHRICVFHKREIS